MIDRSKIDHDTFAEVTTLLMALYPDGETAFPKLVPTLRYIADTMEEVIKENVLQFTTNPTGVTH